MSVWVNFKKTFAFMKGHIKKYSAGIVGMTIMRCTAALLQAFLLELFLKSQGVNNIDQIMKIVLLLVVYVVIILVFLPIFQFWFNGQAKYGHCAINKAIYHKYGDLPMEYYEQNHSGKIMSLLLNDTWLVSTIFMRHFRRVVAASITIVIYVVPMMILDYRITIVLLTISIASMLVSVKVSKVVKKYTKDIQETSEETTSIMNNILSGMSVIRIYRMQRDSIRQFNASNKMVTDKGKKKNKVLSGLSAYQYIMYALKIILFLGIGTFLVQKGLSSFASILAIMSLQSALDKNFEELGTYYPELVNGLVATERVYDFLEQENESNNIVNEKSNIKDSKSAYVEFNDITFSYSRNEVESKTVLKNFSMQIDKGQHIALVGPSGCGKSTLVKLLLGFYPINQGDIKIDGVSIKDMTLDELRLNISYVPQEPELYHTSILENIKYGRWDATEEEIISAAKKANIYDFIMSLPDGFDTLIKENGENLSGGQRQRIAIARALLHDAPVMILDEATSALDNETESKINEMMQYHKDKTIIMIAHRESALNYADRIINMGVVK